VADGEIRVWPTAVVNGDTVTLGDVAELRGLDEATGARLAKLVLRSAPISGGTVLLHSADIRAALLQADANLAQLQIYGSSRCEVSRPRPPRECAPQESVRRMKALPRVKAASEAPPPAKSCPSPLPEQVAEVRPDTLETVLRQYIAARVPDAGAKLEISFSPAGRAMLSLPSAEHQFKIHPANDHRLGVLSFDIDIVRDGAAVQSEPVVAQVELQKEVVVARRAINQGETIAGRDLKLEERPFTDLEAIGITDLAAAAGQQCGQFVRPGEMLRAEALKARPLVQRGETVTIWARLGGVEVKTTGQAQAAGAMGDVISVRRDGSKRKQELIEAVVTGPKTVTVAEARQVAGR
jgi:flagella basal body P-ring formation protein FlgA